MSVTAQRDLLWVIYRIILPACLTTLGAGILAIETGGKSFVGLRWLGAMFWSFVPDKLKLVFPPLAD